MPRVLHGYASELPQQQGIPEDFLKMTFILGVFSTILTAHGVAKDGEHYSAVVVAPLFGVL